MKKSLIIFIVLALLLSLSACSSADVETEDESFGILCSNFPAYDFVRNIVGDRLPVKLLIAPGAESHSYEPTAKDMILMQKWLLVCNGGESEVWVQQMIDGGQMNYEPLRMLDCVEKLEEEHKAGMQLPKGHEHGHGHEAEHDEHEAEYDEHDEHDAEYDEHVWTSPKNAIIICNQICDTLCNIDPEGAAFYTENCLSYCQELQKLDDAFREVADNSESKCLIFADRFPVRYFVEEYGLDYYAAFPGCAAESEPSARTVAFLIDRVREYKVPAVLYIEFSNEKMADIICEDTGCEKLLFHSCHNVSADDFEAGEGYLEHMWENVETLKGALGYGDN